MGRLVLQPGPERRRTSSHYTPRELSGPIVRRTLEPLLAVMGESPASERILNLKVCDPAMGSGAFLVEACRFLGDEVVAAWAREGQLPTGEDPTLAARRLVAQRCLYGVDKNAYAVDLAKLSLWLVTLAKDLPFTFLDHALRHGDSLVGLDFDQIRAGHWKPGKQLETAELTLREALDEAIQIRMDILELARDPSPEAQREKERKLGDADDALRHARLLADIVVGAFFAHEKDKDREKERQKRVDAFAAWKASGDIDVPEQLAQWQMQIRERLPVFHWMLEFPEVFYAERPDPLDENQVNRAAYMDAFVGNPPFAGGLTMSGHVGNAYLAWGKDVLGLRSVKADLAAYFLRRAGSLLGTHGAMGFLATNTIAQGDTRLAGLAELVRQGFVIYEAVRSMLWPGEAAVAVAVVHLARGSVSTSAGLIKRLDGAVTSSIDSFLSPRAERPAPLPLVANGNLAFQGVIAQGAGFVLEPEERDRLIAADARNDQVIFPYLGGAEVNTSPSQQFERYVISFGERPLGEAEQWPLVLDVLRQRVKPERDRLRDDQATARIAKERWWLFWAPRTERFADLRLRERCLVAARVTKHLCFSFQSTSRVFNEKLYVFPFDHLTPFAVLQSRIHDRWTWLLSSTMKNDLNYSASDCFETFPFPQPDPRAVIPHLEDVGQRLYDARAKYMIDEQVGLTITYNRLKDPTVTEARIVELRRLHEEMDAAVLGAYGWSDLVVPPFCIATDADKKALETFENEVIDRLFVLNAKRAEEERVLGAGAAKGAKGGKARGKGGNKKGGAGQGEIPL